MLIVGLTGGIASGKSIVANEFSKLGVDIIDADKIAREVVLPGEPALKKITEHFGDHLLLTNKKLNRNQLKKIIFSNSEERKWLENLLHPLIRERLAEKIKTARSLYCIVVIPLLIETSAYHFIKRILVVDIELKKQQERLKNRDLLSDEEIQKILATQTTRDKRLAKANDILDNNGTKKELKRKILQLHSLYLTLAKQKDGVL